MTWWMMTALLVGAPMTALSWVWMVLRWRERLAEQQRPHERYRPSEAQIRWAKADMPDVSDYHERYR